MPINLKIGNTDTETQVSPEHVPGQSETGQHAAPASAAAKDTISASEVIKATEYTKIPSLSLSSPGGANAPNSSPGNSTVAVGGMIDGKLAVKLMDSVLPAVFILLFNQIGMKMRKSDLQLSAGEIDTIAPVMKAWLDTMMINFNNPATAFFCTVGIIYGSKIMEKGGVQWLDEKNAKKEMQSLAKRAKDAQVVTNEKMQAQAKETQYAIEVTAAQNYVPTVDEVKAFAKKSRCKVDEATRRIVFQKVKEVKIKYGYGEK